jgi:hypothetical protein
VVRVKPNAIKAWREGEVLSGAESDEGDAELIAEYLRLRHHRLQWRPRTRRGPRPCGQPTCLRPHRWPPTQVDPAVTDCGPALTTGYCGRGDVTSRDSAPTDGTDPPWVRQSVAANTAGKPGAAIDDLHLSLLGARVAATRERSTNGTGLLWSYAAPETGSPTPGRWTIVIPDDGGALFSVGFAA